MTPEEVLRRLDAPLSLRRRLGYAAVGLAGLVGGGLVVLLWATEPELPPRTAVAFAVLAAIGAGWAGVAAWVLTRRTPLFARDRVVTAWAGVVAWAVFALGASAIALVRHEVRPAPVVLVLVLGAVAAVNLRAARRARAALLERKARLGRESLPREGEGD
ncbi:hypothetical protein ACFFSW_22665 [Saccharothrix longispora]|uniref:Transmembrane transport protein n=1 Tax=Saccharothrix longispora TaxID=33920 RepID=A0ABU1PQW8_9PSEU|nr:hypothetical protein [Saccharothrix longispora]MDR6593028.1 hypothetical protein [Saccharothrix longispora]